MGLSPVSLKSLLPSFPPWRRDPSSQSVWSLHTLLYRAKWALIDWTCMHANEVQNGTNQKEVLNLERDWGDRWASPKCASFPTMMVVGIISYHKDVARQIAYRKSLGFFFFFGCYGDSPITLVLRAAAVISAWNFLTDVNTRLQWMTVGRVLQSLIIGL